MLQQVIDGIPQAGVRLHQHFVKLGLEPGVQFFHHWLTVLLVENQTLLRRHALFPRHRIMAVNLSQRLQHKPAWLWKIGCHLHKIAPAVRITVSHQRLHQLRHVP